MSVTLSQLLNVAWNAGFELTDDQLLRIHREASDLGQVRRMIENLAGLPAAADVRDNPDDWSDARAYRTLLARHWSAFAALSSGVCSAACLAASDRHGACDCICEGSYHAFPWAIDVGDGEGPGDAWLVLWSSPEQIRNDEGWGHAQRCDRSATFPDIDSATAFMRATSEMLGVSAEIVAFPPLL